MDLNPIAHDPLLTTLKLGTWNDDNTSAAYGLQFVDYDLAAVRATGGLRVTAFTCQEYCATLTSCGACTAAPSCGWCAPHRPHQNPPPLDAVFGRAALGAPP